MDAITHNDKLAQAEYEHSLNKMCRSMCKIIEKNRYVPSADMEEFMHATMMFDRALTKLGR